MAQLGGLVMLDPKDQAAKEQFFFGGIEGCRFRRPVVPGDTLVSHAAAAARPAATQQGSDGLGDYRSISDSAQGVCCSWGV